MPSRTPPRRSPSQRSPSAAPGLDLLERLPEDEREILILSSFYGLAKDEIASVIGVSVQWVDALAARAREHLRLLLATTWPETRAA